jgi:hypothetical protein
MQLEWRLTDLWSVELNAQSNQIQALPLLNAKLRYSIPLD